jgi:hypothetical protein
MGNINVGRWILGGVVAAVVLFIVDFVLHGMVLMQQWADAMAALQMPPMGESAGEIVSFAIFNLIIGLTAVWIYVGIRPRFGPGVQTAIYAGLATWILGYFMPNAFLLVSGMFPASLLWTTIIVALIQVPLATVAGAYLYKEE